MAKRRVCRGPANRLIMMRTRGLHGPYFQNIGDACVKGQGNAFAQGGPLAGIGYRSGRVIDANTIDITFSEPPQGNLQTGVSIEIDGVPATITNAVAAGSVVTYTIIQSVTDDDVVTWIYDEDVGDITGENGNELRSGTFPVTNPIDTKAPTLQTAEVGNIGGNTYSLTFSEPIQSTDFAAGWSVSFNAVPQTMTGNSLYDGGVLYLTTVQYAQEGDTVTISYNSAAGDITDVTGYPSLNDMADITDFAVTNNVVAGPDTERPQVSAFQANGGSATSTSRTISIDTLDATDNVSAAADMEYQVNTSPSNPPSPGDPNWVSFANRLNPITLPSDGVFTLTAYVKDEAGNVSLGVGLSQQVVEVDSIAPTVLNANVDSAGTTLTINLSEAVTGNAGFSLTADAAGVALSTPGGSGSQITFTCAQVYQGQALLLSYTAGDVIDGLGNPLANFADLATANNSTVPVPAGPTLEFHAIAPDGSEIMQGVLVGTDGLVEARTSNIWLKDFEDILREFGPEPAYRGGRVTGPVGSRVVYANDGVSPLAEMPYIVHAPQSTNYVQYSSDPTQSIWAKQQSIVVTDPIAAPDGTTNAVRFEHTTSSSASLTQETDPNSLIVTASAFVKQHTGDYMRWFVSFFGASVNFGGWINYTTEQLEGMAPEGGGVLLDYGLKALPNGWYRIWMKGSTNNINEAKIWFYNTTGINKSRLLGGSSYVWGVQIEPGEALTPVIPTLSAPVTRDACALSFNSANHSDTIGAYYAEFDLTGDSDLIDGFLSLSDPNAVLSDGTNSASLAAAVGVRKIGFVYGDGNMELNVDGIWSTQVPYDGTLLQGVLDIFRASTVNGAIRNLQRWNGTYADLKAKIDELMT